MKLTATMMLSLDGVYQGPGGPDEDRRNGFDRGGWTAAFGDEEGYRLLTALFERADALLLGLQDVGDLAAVLAAPRRAATRSPTGSTSCPSTCPSKKLKDPTWQNTHVITGDVEAAVRELKAQPGRELQVHGSGKLLRWLLERDLVDELNLRVYPVIVGDGMRLFPEQGQSHSLELVDSTSTPSGVLFQTYRPAGRATFANVGD